MKPAHISSPIDVGQRPYEVISVDPKPMTVTDKETGFDSILVVVDRYTGFIQGIPHYQ
eukprot:SAG22_NODE_23_length_31399_cov_35.631313_35_plen_58_part_00